MLSNPFSPIKSIQTGDDLFEGVAAVQMDFAVTAVVVAKSYIQLLISGTPTGTTAAAVAQECMIRAYLTSTTNLRVVRGGGVAADSISYNWSLIEFR